MDATNTHPKDKGKNITDTKSRNWHTYIYKLAQLPTFVSKIDFLPLILGGECVIIRISFKPHSGQDDGAFFIDCFFRLLKKMGESFYTLTLLLERCRWTPPERQC
jgi:hypothetical protein